MLGCVPQILILFCAKMQWLSDFMGYSLTMVYPFLMSPRCSSRAKAKDILFRSFFYFFRKKIAEFTTVRGHFQNRLVTTKTIREQPRK